MRSIPEVDALRIGRCGQERRACDAEMALLAEQHRQLQKQRDAANDKIQEIMKLYGLSLDDHAVITADDAHLPVGTVVNAKTNQPASE